MMGNHVVDYTIEEPLSDLFENGIINDDNFEMALENLTPLERNFLASFYVNRETISTISGRIGKTFNEVLDAIYDAKRNINHFIHRSTLFA